jgi:4-amino-4-deoxy-L-arabinose transferase-like glycosyltransferase
MSSRVSHPLSESPDTVRSNRWWLLGLVAVLVLLAFHFACGLNRPWVEEDNWYGAVYAQAAHNNLRAGLYAGGVPATLYFGPLPIPPEAYYVHHPTLLPLLVTASFAALGEAEWSARLVPVLASLCSVVILWLLLRGTVGPRAATLGAAVFAAVPMELHYGDMVDFEPVLTLWMLALLLCIWRWEHPGGQRRWAVVGAVFAALALWTDWPGYLLVLSLAGWFVFFAPRGRRWFGWLLGGLVFLAGVLFLLQIRSANAAAWSDLWTALQMRRGNAIPTSIAPITASAPHFTTGDWARTVFADLRNNYLPLAWLFVGLGIVRLLRGWRTDGAAHGTTASPSSGVRWVGWAAAHLFIAGTLYVVLLRNESFIHDFAPFYIIGAVALLAGLGLDAVCRAAEGFPRPFRLATGAAVGCGLVALAVLGFRQSEDMRSPYLIFNSGRPEPAQLIPALGRALAGAFPQGETVMANFDPYGSALTYYAQRPLLTNLLTVDDWNDALAHELVAGGVIWLGDSRSKEILDSLPGQITRIEIAGYPFAFWHVPPHQKIQ